MRPAPTNNQSLTVASLGLVAVLLVSTASAQLIAKRGSKLESAPELLSSGDQPVLRFPVAHAHGMGSCRGYLYFSRDTIRYELAPSEGSKEHAFEYPVSRIASAQMKTQRGTNFTRAEYKFSSGTTYNFFNLSGQGRFSEKEMPSAQPLVDAVTNFDELLAVFQAREARPRPPAPPSISVLEPSGADGGKAVATGRNLRVRGLASHASGIASVLVNGQPAFLKPMTAQTTEFEARDLPFSAGANSVVVVASATDRTTAQRMFQVAKAEIRLLGPLAGYESPEPTVNVRGRVSGFGEITSVDLAGVRARLKPQADGTTEFEAEKVPLPAVGVNALDGVVATSAGIREPFTFEVRRKQLQPPTLSIISKPGAVQVYVDDEPRGITSSGGKLVLRDLPAGSHRVRLSLAGYQDWEQTLDLVAGGSHTVEASLTTSGPPPFTLQDVVDMLQGEISSRRVAALVQERGVDFALTDEAEKKIRAAGGDTDLLLAVARARK
jgi:hypothetical protein